MSSAVLAGLKSVFAFSLLLILPAGRVTASVCSPINLGYLIGEDHVTFSRGCYHSRGQHQVFPTSSLVSFRGHIDWDLWQREGSAKQIIVECAKMAIQRGAPSFGVEFYGECYTGDQPDISQGQVTPADDCNRLCFFDVGAANAMVVYDVFEWYTA